MLAVDVSSCDENSGEGGKDNVTILFSQKMTLYFTDAMLNCCQAKKNLGEAHADLSSNCSSGAPERVGC